jgi:ribosomal protein S18 acetylase RimI-like enzyme
VGVETLAVTFKDVTAADLDTLVPLMDAYYEFDGIPFDAARARKAVIGLLENDSLGKAWLISQENAVAGYVVITYDYGLESGGREAFIDELYLKTDYRGQGIGRKTIVFLEQFCASVGVRTLLLGVEPENTEAQAFYQAVGFEDRRLRMMTKRIATEEQTR